MTSNDTPKAPNKSGKARGIERIEKMYKLADQIYGGLNEAELAAYKANAPANQHLSKPTSTQDTVTDSDSANEIPRWCLSVLKDLANFAENEGLSQLHVSLRDAHLRVAEVLNMMETREDSECPNDEDESDAPH